MESGAQPKVFLFDIGGVIVSESRRCSSQLRLDAGLLISVMQYELDDDLGAVTFPSHRGLRAEPRHSTWMGQLLNLKNRSGWILAQT